MQHAAAVAAARMLPHSVGSRGRPRAEIMFPNKHRRREEKSPKSLLHHHALACLGRIQAGVAGSTPSDPHGLLLWCRTTAAADWRKPVVCCHPSRTKKTRATGGAYKLHRLRPASRRGDRETLRTPSCRPYLSSRKADIRAKKVTGGPRALSSHNHRLPAGGHCEMGVGRWVEQSRVAAASLCGTLDVPRHLIKSVPTGQ